MTSVQERFQAAVNVIKGLPKNGPYQPSNSMMLKFYGLYKQATLGVCPKRKPAFWDVVNKAKWEAWNRNSHLTKEEAMQKYVENLQEIIETMSFTENVQHFVGSLQGFENINLDELEMIAPGMKELAESHPNSPFHSRGNSPQHSANEIEKDLNVNGHDSSLDNVIIPHTSPTQKTELCSQSSLFFNSREEIEADYSQTNGVNQSDQSDEEYVDPFDIQNELNESIQRNTNILKEVQATVLRLNSDTSVVSQHLFDVEKAVSEMKDTIAKQFTANNAVVMKHKYSKWWPFSDISPLWFALLISWPFIVRKFAKMLGHSPKRK